MLKIEYTLWNDATKPHIRKHLFGFHLIEHKRPGCCCWVFSVLGARYKHYYFIRKMACKSIEFVCRIHTASTFINYIEESSGCPVLSAHRRYWQFGSHRHLRRWGAKPHPTFCQFESIYGCAWCIICFGVRHRHTCIHVYTVPCIQNAQYLVPGSVHDDQKLSYVQLKNKCLARS